MASIPDTYKQLEEYRDIIREIVKNNNDIHGLMDALNQNYIRITANYSKIASIPKTRQATDPVYFAFQQAETLNQKYQEQIGTIASKILELLQRKSAIDSGMALLDESERNILILRYFDHMPWEHIAERTTYSERWCRKIKHIAVRKLAQKLP